MADTKFKGDYGEAMVIAEVMRRGYKVALPVGEDWAYDIIVLRNGNLERVQCKYTESDGNVIHVKCRSTNNWIDKRYTKSDVDWIAVYDKTIDRVFFIPSELLGAHGRTVINLRLTSTKNGQTGGVRFATDYCIF